MNDRILLIMPTRGRTWAALEAIASVMKTADEPNKTDIVVCMDEDDAGVFSIRMGPTSPSIYTHVRPRKRFVEWVNYAWDAYSADTNYCRLGWLADDIRYRTNGWDTRVRNRSELVVYGDDGYQHDQLATHPFIRVEVPRALGYVIPPQLIHGYPDVFIDALGRQIGSIVYDPSIFTEHLHPDAGKGGLDQTYKDEQLYWIQDRATWEAILKPQIPALADKVRDYMTQLAK